MFCEKGVTFTFDSLEQDKQTWTYGGYSKNMVVDERYVLRIPRGLDAARAAPLMCAGITTYSPLRQFGCKRGDQVAVVGLGGLGHMVVRFAASMGADVTVLSTSRDKEKDAARLGAKRFVPTREPDALEALEGMFDLIVDTVSAPHDLNKQLTLLRNFGTMVLVGLAPADTPLHAGAHPRRNAPLRVPHWGGFRETRETRVHRGGRSGVGGVEHT